MSYPRAHVRTYLQFKLPDQWRRHNWRQKKRNWARIYAFLSPSDLYDISREGLREQDREEQERFDREKAEREEFVAKQKAEVEAQRARETKVVSPTHERKRASLMRELEALKKMNANVIAEKISEGEKTEVELEKENIGQPQESCQDDTENAVAFKVKEPVDQTAMHEGSKYGANSHDGSKFVKGATESMAVENTGPIVGHFATLPIDGLGDPTMELPKLVFMGGEEGGNMNYDTLTIGRRMDSTQIAMKLSSLNKSNASPDYVQATWPEAKVGGNDGGPVDSPPPMSGPYRTEVMGRSVRKSKSYKKKKNSKGKRRFFKKGNAHEFSNLKQVFNPQIRKKKYVKKLKICRKLMHSSGNSSSGESSLEYFIKTPPPNLNRTKIMRKVRYTIQKYFTAMPGISYRCPQMHLQSRKIVGGYENGTTQIWLCLVCHKQERDENGDIMICCEKCEDWYHLRCVGVPNEEYPENMNWYCKRCIVRQVQQGEFDISAFPLYQPEI